MPKAAKKKTAKKGAKKAARKAPVRTRASGERNRASQAQRSREKNLAVREVGPIAKPKWEAQRAKARGSFRMFCETFQRHRFPLAWSEDHLRVIARIEQVVLEGGTFALAMPRGNGKTTLCESAAVWALLYGHRGFVVLIGATDPLATDILTTIKRELTDNVKLGQAFPEICQPIRALEGIAHRAKGQLVDGKRTHIVWGKDEVHLPTIEGADGSGGIIRVSGITGSIRGMKHGVRRPDLVIPDDPQTDESAKSVKQCEDREEVIAGAVLGLGGPGSKIAALMPCTVIKPGDLADRILDRSLHPEWNGERTKMVYEWPTNAELWDQYTDAYKQSFKDHGDYRDATKFYRRHRTKMEKGAKVAWPERKNDDEASALQHAFNLRLRDPRAFAAEYQNDPLADIDDSERPVELTRRGLVARAAQSGIRVDHDEKTRDGDSMHLVTPPDEQIVYAVIGVDVQRGGERAPGRLYWVMEGTAGSGTRYLLAWGTIKISEIGTHPTAAEIRAGLEQLDAMAATQPFDDCSAWEGFNPPIVFIAVDVGDQQDKLVPWIRTKRKWLAVKGEASAKVRQASTPNDVVGFMYPRPQKNGAWTLYLVPSALVRADVHSSLTVKPLDPSSLNLPDGISTGDAIVRHLVGTIEILDPKRGMRWSQKPDDRQFHPEWQRRIDYLAALVYARAAGKYWEHRGKRKRRRRQYGVIREGGL